MPFGIVGLFSKRALVADALLAAIKVRSTLVAFMGPAFIARAILASTVGRLV
jgi:hypothetical protein